MLGATDAAKPGMGGVFFDANDDAYVWRYPFPDTVQKRLVSADNPSGSVTNSDLEHTALLAQVDAMCCLTDLAYATLENFSDNTPAVSRVRKGAVASHGAAAALCRFASDHQRLHRYCHTAQYLPGEQNTMADDASRLQALTDVAFLSHFNQRYPQPRPWQLLHLRSETASRLISSLLCKSPTPPSPAKPPRPASKSSVFGQPSVLSTVSTLRSATSSTANSKSSTSSSSASDISAAAKKESLSSLVQSRMPCWRWARGSPTWVNQIPERKFQDPAATIPNWLLTSRDSATTKNPPSAPTRPTFQFSDTCGRSSGSTTLPQAMPTGSSATYQLLPSTGSCGPPSTPLVPVLAVPKPSDSRMSSSPWETSSAMPPTRL